MGIQWTLNWPVILNTSHPYVQGLVFNQATQKGKVCLENLPLELDGSIVQCRDVYNHTEDGYGTWRSVDTLTVEG